MSVLPLIRINDRLTVNILNVNTIESTDGQTAITFNDGETRILEGQDAADFTNFIDGCSERIQTEAAADPGGREFALGTDPLDGPDPRNE